MTNVTEELTGEALTTHKLALEEGVSEYDLAHFREIIKENEGNWYHAKLIRALYALLQDADEKNRARLERAYPGTVRAIHEWYNGRYPFKREQAEGDN